MMKGATITIYTYYNNALVVLPDTRSMHSRQSVRWRSCQLRNALPADLRPVSTGTQSRLTSVATHEIP